MADEQRLFEVASTTLHRGVHLIEASAGTGKTYTIGMLVLRFIAEKNIPIEEILLVTFTRAATAELADRVRLRLTQARDLLEGKTTSGDETMLRWAATLDERGRALKNLRQALIDVDRAPIFTIHGFCQRMLQEQTLESGQLFHAELLPDNEKLEQMVVSDYWRQRIYFLSRLQANIVLAHYPSPTALFRSVGPLSQNLMTIKPRQAELESAARQVEKCYEEVAAWWQENGRTLHEALAGMVADGLFKKDFTTTFDHWWYGLNHYFHDPETLFPDKLKTLLPEELANEFNGNKVRGAKKAEALELLPLPEKELSNFLETINELLLCLRVDFAHSFLAQTEKRMLEANTMAYDDLIIRLQRAVSGDTGEELVRLLRRRFSAAVIDEFQDTDNIQWQIFQTIFAGAHHFLYLIGDPKQAIYRFRGADIHTYFEAKRSAAEILTLAKNYRSHPGVIEGVNTLFSKRNRPFLFEQEKLDFSPAIPALGADEVFLQSGEKVLANMVYCQLDEAATQKDATWSTGEAARAIQHHIVNEINHLFERNTKVVKQKESRMLQCSDIAILVRTHNQAEEYRSLLGEVGIPAVTAGKLSVFQSVEAGEFYQLLDALVHPHDVGLFKRAMTISWLGYSGNELHRFWQDDQLFDHYFTRFQEYGLNWHQQGVLLTLNHFLEHEGVLTTLGTGVYSERKITNIYHLAELLQKAEDDNMFSPRQLLQWLRRQLDQPTTENELRLESDEEAVRIVTMHASKGLEYPVVFCPALWHRTSQLEKQHERIVCREDAGLVLDLGSTRFNERKEAILFEEMAEELRLCYVAVTRAKLRCYIVWCDSRGRKGGAADAFASGLGYLLFPEGRIGFGQQQEVLKEMGRNPFCMYQLIDSEPILKIPSPRVKDTAGSFVKKIRKRLPLSAGYHMTSYSALVSGGGNDKDDESSFEPFGISPIHSIADSGPPVPFADLPSGPNFGNVVHDILESIPFFALTQTDGHKEEIVAICRKYGVEVDLPQLLNMLSCVVSTPLVSADHQKDPPPTLAQLAKDDCKKEMGFYFHLSGGSTADINRLLRDVKTVKRINERDLRGYLTGFIDLVFVYDQTFYIVDYKTNNLGDGGDSYERDNLITAMADHNYGLQYYLYTLVIDRYLKNVLPSYDYDVHFGGIFYLFVRGMNGGKRGIFYDKPERTRLAELARCFEVR